MLSKISIVIPVLNEAHHLSKTLATLTEATGVDLIVVDGGSQDDTIAVAQSAHAKVISAPAGRAAQMNAGAAIATGEILLFLHADTQLPLSFETLIRGTLAQPRTIAGAFDLTIDAPGFGVRLVEWGVHLRSRYLQLPYGDQAIFLPKPVFHAVGGFPDLPIMEDFELVQRLHQHGKIAIVPAPVITSGRRWQRLGVLRTTLVNQLVIGAYVLGISPDLIRRWYRSGLGRG
ncbi:TIGR04283 family arsenosugar biosynthesis glycosyltransferase [Myxacorys almedinensis]|uniref:4,4'-diaponeurosporenoate glycosyltransferase n=1 Tax=Myxacorys almedinensis A TaxID=2690445 RepID=A0A8J7Z011_9CYAN|nr:TIGR04283 family arsenosugar biosynthesis glycosyltransferase [Myxacorys almedinensis]NDJ17214.1 glycosyltransferase [Myxacorys almedinensis A]